MASILQTDLLDLVNQWEERVAFNEGFRKQKISAASGAGRDAFSSGLSRSQGQDAYFQSRQQMNSEAAEFLAGDSAAEGVEDVDIEPIGEITDGEEMLGMESAVSGESIAPEFDIDEYAMAPDVLSDQALQFYSENGGNLRDIAEFDNAYEGDWYSEAMQDHAEAVEFDLQRRGWL